MRYAREIYDHIKKFEECALLAGSDFEVTGPADFNSYSGKALVFYKGNSVEPLLKHLDDTGGLIITHSKFSGSLKKGPFLLVSDPQLAFIHATSLFGVHEKPLIHPTALIDPGAVIGKEVAIGPYSVVGKAIIGDHSKLGSFVSVKSKVKIGERALVMDGAVIGEPGLGSIMDYDGSQVLFPHFGGVSIGANFVLGSSSVVNCGSLKDTVIEDHVHISSNCLVAHNCWLGSNVYLAATAKLAGSVKVGARSYIGFGAIVTNGVELAEQVTIGVGAVIMKSILEKGTTVMSQPQLKNLGKLFSIKREG